MSRPILPAARAALARAALASLAAGALLAATVVHATACGAQAAPPPALAGLDGADSIAAAEFARDSVASLTVGVVTARGLAWTRSYGYADARRPADRRTVYRVGSVTKMFTGLMLQQLVADGTVRLDDPVERHYPAIREVDGYATLAAPITWRQLATMTAGLAREPRAAGPFWTGPLGEWESTLARALPHVRLEHAPGERFAYSNAGFAILGAALARAAGVPYLRWQEERILAPLGMRRTTFDVDARTAADLARGYEITRGGRVLDELPARETRLGRGYRVPAGAVLTDVDDLARFVRLWLGHGPVGVLAPARVEHMLAEAVAIDSTDAYGTGFARMRRHGHTWYGHGGAVAGYTAAVYLDRERGIATIVLRNATGGQVRADPLAAALLRHLVEAQATAPAP